MRRSFQLLSLVSVALSLASCQPPAQETKPAQPKPSAPRPFIRLTLTRDGKTLVDGAPKSPSELRTIFKSTAVKKGVVLYYAEVTEGDGSPEALPLLTTLAEAGVELKTAKKPDFSDLVGPDGKLLADDEGDGETNP